jgi:hypothetical protein
MICLFIIISSTEIILFRTALPLTYINNIPVVNWKDLNTIVDKVRN